MQSLDAILANMDLKAIEWLMYALDDAAIQADNEYVQPEYQVRQEQVSEGLWKLARLVEVGMLERS